MVKLIIVFTKWCCSTKDPQSVKGQLLCANKRHAAVPFQAAICHGPHHVVGVAHVMSFNRVYISVVPDMIPTVSYGATLWASLTLTVLQDSNRFKTHDSDSSSAENITDVCVHLPSSASPPSPQCSGQRCGSPCSPSASANHRTPCSCHWR